ncbi:hypothetical protein GCM10022393_01920 [Aquimarina addita]|uniref:LysM domain-containing protein n=1 Tax=Aquimarina addita TaxID=870485 RepID=A0ABP7X895_9FLAO
MFIALIVVAVVAVAVFAFNAPGIGGSPVSSPSDSPLPADDTIVSEIDEVLQDIQNEVPEIPEMRPQARPANIEPDQQGQVAPDTTDTAEDESVSEESVTQELNNNSTAANDAKEDGINDAYFAKEEYVNEGNEPGSPYEYEYGNNDKNYKANPEKLDGDVDHILNASLSVLDPRKEYVTKDIIKSKLEGNSYSAHQVVSFETYKKTPRYVKIENAPLEAEVYIVAKTTNLDEETVTITIQEKEELLVGKDAPLPVLEMPEEEENAEESTTENERYTQQESRMGHDSENQDSGGRSLGNGASGNFESPDQQQGTDRTTNDANTVSPSQSEGANTEEQEEETGQESESQDAEENEITEIKAVVEEGIAKKKIKLRPKSAEDLQRWKDLLAGKEEETATLAPATPQEIAQSTPQTPLSFGSDIPADTDSSFGALGNLSFPDSLGSVPALAQTYTVKSGDTLSTIASQNDVSIQELQTANGITNPNSLNVGQQLTIPNGGGSGSGGTSTPASASTTETLTPKTKLLWLKAHAFGGEEEHNEEFLNEDENKENENDSYFEISDCIILNWGSKLTCQERKRVLLMAKNLELADNNALEGANWIMSIMALESARTFDPSIQNDLGYTGLIQFGDAAASDLNTTTSLLKEMTVLEQLDYVEKYFERKKTKLKTLADMYLAVLYPNATGNGNNPNYVVFDATSSIRSSRRGYSQNPAFFFEDSDSASNATGKTYVWEVARKIQEFYDEGLGHKNKCDCNSSWHDPVDNPMLCLYSQGGGLKPWHGSFGEKIRDNTNKHTGMDLFAKPYTNVYACVKGKVVRSETNASLFGDLVVIEVIDVDTIKNRRKNPFTLKYANKTEIESQNFDHNGPFYLLYAHLAERKVQIGDEVDAGKIIGLSGTSGNNGVPFTTKNPHVHFEIMNIKRGGGLNNKCNPGVYLTYKDEDTMSQSEKDEQTMVRNTSEYHKQ